MPGETPAERAAGEQRDAAGPAPEGTGRPGGATAAREGGAAARSSTTRPPWILAAATFVVGLLLGSALTLAAGGRDPEVAPTTTEPSASPTTPAPSPPDDGAVTVPGSCLDVADRAEGLAALVRDAAEAAGELDAAALSAIVRELEESQAGLEAETTRCRAGADAVP